MNRLAIKLFNFSSTNSTPIQWIKNKFNLKNTRGQFIFNDIETYIFGNQFNSKIQCDQILIRYNFLIVHIWLVQQALQQHLLKNYVIKQQLESILYKSASNYIYQFDDNYNQEMRQELERNQEVLQFVLDDYFIYQFKKKSLEQIVFEDILLRQQSEKQKIDKICTYIINNYNHMLKYDQGVLRGEKEKIIWVE
ncbi:unnamed protein product [Paramecium pentaurelia]|uniref:Uncharacterized protein n=1 Tax=Paramecium pentaurelia TaxID=43138 RepID=A0A8S1V932_9CILI|nr:unnamed protein product [Paramecium pentaurelia]